MDVSVPVLLAATLEDIFIRRPQIRWFRSVRRPRILVPFPVLVPAVVRPRIDPRGWPGAARRSSGRRDRRLVRPRGSARRRPN